MAKETFDKTVLRYIKSKVPSAKKITTSMIKKGLVKSFPYLSIPVDFYSSASSASSLRDDWKNLFDSFGNLLTRTYYLTWGTDYTLSKNNKEKMTKVRKEIDSRVRHGSKNVINLYNEIHKK